MAKTTDNSAPDTSKKLYSVNIAHRFTDAAGNERVKFRELSVGFANKKGGLGFTLPKGLSIGSDADIVIFPIEHDAD